MILTINWSPEIKIQYGKNIRVKYGKEDFSIRISEIGAGKIFAVTDPLENKFIIYSHEIEEIANPHISFKSSGKDEITVEYELF